MPAEVDRFLLFLAREAGLDIKSPDTMPRVIESLGHIPSGSESPADVFDNCVDYLILHYNNKAARLLHEGIDIYVECFSCPSKNKPLTCNEKRLEHSCQGHTVSKQYK